MFSLTRLYVLDYRDPGHDQPRFTLNAGRPYQEFPVVLYDTPLSSDIIFPADKLSDTERLDRLFMNVGKRWRLLAILTVAGGAGHLLCPELKVLIRELGPRGLLSRIVFQDQQNLRKLEKKVRDWECPNTRVSGLSIHASRIAGSSALPLVRLYDPDDTICFSSTGFDTEKGLDDLVDLVRRILPAHST